jgi:hypothetical protein
LTLDLTPEFTVTVMNDIPIVCDMTDAPDTPRGRLAEYRQLFARSLVGRRRTPGGGVCFRFRNGPGVEDHVRDLADREKACCAFFSFEIAVHGDEVHETVTVVDDPVARQILDEYYRLPETAGEDVAALHGRFGDQGLTIVIDDDGVRRPATPGEIGLPT